MVLTICTFPVLPSTPICLPLPPNFFVSTSMNSISGTVPGFSFRHPLESLRLDHHNSNLLSHPRRHFPLLRVPFSGSGVWIALFCTWIAPSMTLLSATLRSKQGMTSTSMVTLSSPGLQCIWYGDGVRELGSAGFTLKFEWRSHNEICG